MSSLADASVLERKLVSPAAIDRVTELPDPGGLPLQSSQWTNMNPIKHPPARSGASFAYDGESDRVILFGGRTTYTNSQLNDTWSYDFNRNSWTNMSPSSHPSARDSHVMAYDSESDRIVMFGGRLDDVPTYSADTWAYDFNANTWTDTNPTLHPSPRKEAAIAYDSESDRVILFGGAGLSGRGDETWAYDFNANTWTDTNPTASPPPRFQAAMAYDIESDRAIVFGGNVADSAPPFAADTWAYDLNANSWVARNPPTNPGVRGGHAIAYDSESDLLVLHGGVNGFAVLVDTWLYDFNSDLWADAVPSTSGPARWYSSMAYDAESDRAILFGGEPPGPPYVVSNETWAYFREGGFSPPSEPLNLGAAPADARATLSWQAPAWNGGPSITSFRIYRATAPGAETFLVDAGNVLTYTDSGLTNGITYYYQVAAANAIGEGQRSNQASARPVTLPFAPQNLVATPGDAVVTLAWSAPTSDGGSPITGYSVYRGDAEGSLTLLTALGTALTYTDSGLTNGRTYYYAVSAVNAPGEGPRSNAVPAIPRVAGATGLDPLALLVIGGVTAAVAVGAGFVLIKRWRKPRE